jgi:hypothetical protein
MSWYKLRLVIDASACQLLLMGLTGWLARRERAAITDLIEENRLLRRRARIVAES